MNRLIQRAVKTKLNNCNSSKVVQSVELRQGQSEAANIESKDIQLMQPKVVSQVSVHPKLNVNLDRQLQYSKVMFDLTKYLET